ncbi:hypothetical protein PF003_g20296 [Phytophthora fragariae]|nr:hypothetical protein PF003_g20296 [Phytophthora fragariae]
MAGPARQWYLQLGRETRTSWEKLTEQFLVQYCDKGVSMASHYYHATKRSDETPLDYLYQLNVAGLRAGLHIMEGSVQQKREHVEHYVRTLGRQEPELAMQLTMLMVPDVPMLESVLRKRQRSLESQKKSLFGSNKYRQEGPVQNGPPRVVHAVQAETGPGSIQLDEEETWDYGQDYDDAERARLHVTTQRNPEPGARRDDPTETGPRPPCPHCKSTRHLEADCWQLLTCSKCGGHHPSDRCLRTCKACGDVHAAGECPMEEFFNQLRQWYDPSKHGGMLPLTAEQMLN